MHTHITEIQHHELFQHGYETYRVYVSGDNRADTAVQALRENLNLARDACTRSRGSSTSAQRWYTSSRLVAPKPEKCQKCAAVAYQQLAKDLYVSLRAPTAINTNLAQLLWCVRCCKVGGWLAT